MCTRFFLGEDYRATRKVGEAFEHGADPTPVAPDVTSAGPGAWVHSAVRGRWRYTLRGYGSRVSGLGSRYRRERAALLALGLTCHLRLASDAARADPLTTTRRSACTTMYRAPAVAG